MAAVNNIIINTSNGVFSSWSDTAKYMQLFYA